MNLLFLYFLQNQRGLKAFDIKIVFTKSKLYSLKSLVIFVFLYMLRSLELSCLFLCCWSPLFTTYILIIIYLLVIFVTVKEV